jgi:hypothetical protein
MDQAHMTAPERNPRAGESIGECGASVVFPAGAGEPLLSTPRSERPPSDEDAVVPSSSPVGAERISFAAFAHQQVRDYIQLADQKAAVLFSAAGAMLAYLHGTNATALWMQEPASWTWRSPVVAVAMIGLVACAGLAGRTLLPRTRGHTKGLLFWSAIAARPNAADYVRDVQHASEAALLESYLSHTHELAAVCTQKYADLRSAFSAAKFAFAAALLHLLLS